MSLRLAVTAHVTAEFLAWVAAERAYTIKLFRLTSTLEDMFLTRWRREQYTNDETLTDLCMATFHRERLEKLLNVLDFGADYGVNFQSPERKILFRKWLQTSTTRKS